jgi:ribonuclease III
MKSGDITELEQTLGYHFQRPALIQQALTHSSQARELESLQTSDISTRFGDNEQLEFLGDAVLGLVTSQELFQRFPGFREGELSKLRAHLVSEKHLIRVARELELGKYLRLGRGEEKSGGRAKPALLVDALEAVLAAMYLDGGLDVTRAFILHRILGPELSDMALDGGAVLPITDFKSALQEKLQAKGCPQPSYVLVREEGPEHNKTFTVEVKLRLPGGPESGEVVARATGSTKKKAEQDAARQALQHLAAGPEPAAMASKEGSSRVER